MQLFVILVLLVVFVILCDKYEDKLFPPISWIYALWKKFSHVLGIIMSFIILTILWIVGFGVYAIILKVVTLPRLFRKAPSTYWVDAETSDIDSMKHQF